MGARPVMYYPYDPTEDGKSFNVRETVASLRFIEGVYRNLLRRNMNVAPEVHPPGSSETPDSLLRAAEFVMGRDFLAFLVPFDATLSRRDHRNVYMEREWRKVGNVPFSPEDVRYIVAPGDFVSALKREFGERYGVEKIQSLRDHTRPPGG